MARMSLPPSRSHQLSPGNRRGETAIRRDENSVLALREDDVAGVVHAQSTRNGDGQSGWSEFAHVSDGVRQSERELEPRVRPSRRQLAAPDTSGQRVRYVGEEETGHADLDVAESPVDPCFGPRLPFDQRA